MIVFKILHLAAAFVSLPTLFRRSSLSSRIIVAFSTKEPSDLPPSSPNDSIRVWYQLVDARIGALDNDGVGSVKISSNALIDDLRQAIVDKNKLPFVAKSLKVFATREHLDLKEPRMRLDHPLSNLPYMTGETPLYVVVPYIVPPSMEHYPSESPSSLKSVSPERSERYNRWQMLNSILAKNQKARAIDEETATAYSGVTWTDELEPVYRLNTQEYDLRPIKVKEEMLDSLYEYITKLTTVFSSVSRLGTGGRRESKILHFVAPVLVHVCNLFEGGADEIQFLADATVKGQRINVIDGQCDFILERSKKRFCIIEAREDHTAQVLAQVLLGCEAVADTEGVNCVYAIVTNYVEWLFIKNLDRRVEIFEATLQEGSKQSLEWICGLIFAMLSESTNKI
jgi:hypothetical protein